jgi:SAM-dependent methyltransferase
MSFRVLQSKQQVEAARAELDRLGWSFKNGAFRRFLWRASRGRYPRVGDEIKSWDVLSTAQFAKEHLRPDDAVLDFGAYSSEMPLCLHAAGFTSVSGIDLNPHVRFMPNVGHIKYVRGSFHAAPFAAASQSMITAISVIEHGFEPDLMLSEVSRLLKPGGYFVASFDYWPEKIKTDDVKIFDLDWRIFSEDEVREFARKAADMGMRPVGPMIFSASERPADFRSFRYTFGWLALQKEP